MAAGVSALHESALGCTFLAAPSLRTSYTSMPRSTLRAALRSHGSRGLGAARKCAWLHLPGRALAEDLVDVDAALHAASCTQEPWQQGSRRCTKVRLVAPSGPR